MDEVPASLWPPLPPFFTFITIDTGAINGPNPGTQYTLMGGGGGGGGSNNWTPGGVKKTPLCSDPIGKEIVGYLSISDIYSVTYNEILREYYYPDTPNIIERSETFFPSGFFNPENFDIGVKAFVPDYAAAQLIFHEGVHAWLRAINYGGTKGERDVLAYAMEVEFAIRNNMPPIHPQFVIHDYKGNYVPNIDLIKYKVAGNEGTDSGLEYRNKLVKRLFTAFSPFKISCE